MVGQKEEKKEKEKEEKEEEKEKENCCGRAGGSQALQEVLADLKIRAKKLAQQA